MKLTTREWVALVSMVSVIGAGMYLWFTLDVTQASNVKEVIEKQNIVQYDTERETYLYNKVEKTVDLPWFGDYQDLLASYAYNTCKEVEWEITQKKNWYLYDCKTFVLVLNGENGGRNKDAWNYNNDWTKDWGIGQLNSRRHKNFMSSEWFKNPLAQIEYTLWVWKDASRKGVMPWYAFDVRHERDKWIVFAKSEASPQKQANNWGANGGKIYPKAKEAQSRADLLREACKTLWECTQ